MDTKCFTPDAVSGYLNARDVAQYVVNCPYSLYLPHWGVFKRLTALYDFRFVYLMDKSSVYELIHYRLGRHLGYKSLLNCNARSAAIRLTSFSSAR